MWERFCKYFWVQYSFYAKSIALERNSICSVSGAFLSKLDEEKKIAEPIDHYQFNDIPNKLQIF